VPAVFAALLLIIGYKLNKKSEENKISPDFKKDIISV
jgi:hypothetical protein